MSAAIDPYGVNPLVDGYKVSHPSIYARAISETPHPTLFVSGDLPPFTASGVDPTVLNRLPYTMRHWAASEPSSAAVLSVIEDYAADPMFTMEHPGLDDYRTRVDRWIKGLDVPTPEMTEAEGDATLEELFGGN